MKTATKTRKRKADKWTKATVYVTSIEDHNGRRVVDVTMDKHRAETLCLSFNRISAPVGYAWHVGLEIDVPPRSECELRGRKGGAA